MEEKKSFSMVNDLTDGPIAKQLLRFALPLFLSNAMQAIYNVADMVIVGRFIGGSGMSAVATGGNILQILNFFAIGFSGAGQITIAQAVGRKDYDSVKHTIGTMFTVMMSLALAMSIICYNLRAWILQMVNTPAESYGYTMDYTVTCIFGLLFIYGYNIVSAIMRGMGDSRRPFIFITIAACMNILLDLLFIAVFHMEVQGAALATVIGQGFSFLVALVYLYRRREAFGFDFRPGSFVPKREAVARLTALGIPMSIQSASISVSMTIVTAWVNSFGVIYSAIAGIISKINTMAGIMSAALSTAGASMLAQNLGAKKYHRVPRVIGWATAYSAVVSLVLILIMVTVPEGVCGLFTKDGKVLAAAGIIVGPVILNFVGATTRTCGFAIINGSGNSKLNLFIAILDGLVARIGLAYLFGFFFAMGPRGFWYGDALAGFVPLLVGGTYYLTGRWKKE